MCDVCIATTKSYCVDSSNLCETHYFEWVAEKTYNDFDRSTEGLYL